MGLGAYTGRLLGRQRERAVLERLLGTARDGHGSVLVVHGEAGVGKTALLDYTVELAEEFRVLRTVGVEGEIELDYAALQQLCMPALELIGRLPDPQRDAIEIAFGVSAGQAPSPYLVGLAVLGLLSEAAEHEPLLCLVDDAQWLDDASARALTFVAHRLLAEPIVLVFAGREVRSGMVRLPQLHVEPLGRRDARELLEAALPARLDEAVVERIIAETGGNPLAILELPRELTPAQLAGGFGLPVALPLSASIEQSFARRLRRLPPDARRLLLLASAEPIGDPALLWRAAQELGISATVASAVESEGLLTLDGAVTFRHPLVRSAVYGAADPAERREAHSALAQATDPERDPDRRAWHRAQAASNPDEDVARELAKSAARAQARGGFAAAAAFLERAAALTPDESRRSRRALAAGYAKLQAGALDDALRLVATAEAGPLSDREEARVGLLRAQISFVATRGGDSPRLLLEAAERLRGVDPELARDTYLEALTAAIFAGPLAGSGASARDIAAAATAAPRVLKPRGQDLLLDGLVALLCDTYAAAVPILRRAQRALADTTAETERLRWLWGATVASLHLWDDEGWERNSDLHLQLVRDTGALSDLAIALGHVGQRHAFAGDLASAASLQEAVQEATELTGSPLGPYHAATVVALRGREPEMRQFIDAARAEVIERAEGAGLTFMDWAESLLYNGLGRYAEALAAARRVVDHTNLMPLNWAMPELIEAAARVGDLDLAAATDRRLAERSKASGTDWALGIAARSHALLADNGDANGLYIEAIERLARTRIAVDVARAHLLYGEWLRRQRRRMDARSELGIAYEMFTGFGMEAFAERARVELEATGEHARKRTAETRGNLTPQETQIARLARDGLSNAEIGAQLFISKHTVEYHLRKVFAKLGISSRIKLANALPPESSSARIR